MTEINDTANLEQQADDARLAEYEALRAESDRIAQLLSNAVWAGVTGFGLTIAGTAALAGKDNMALLVPIVALLLCIQSLAISTVYAAELWKYIRVGTYIRTYIEPWFQLMDRTAPAPMHWESWIVAHRARALHVGALAFLQAPVALTVLAGVLAFCERRQWLNAPVNSTASYLTYIGGDLLLTLMLAVTTALDIVVMGVLSHRLRQAEGGDFGDGGKSVQALQAAVHRTAP